jgi:hypothetical protein
MPRKKRPPPPPNSATSEATPTVGEEEGEAAAKTGAMNRPAPKKKKPAAKPKKASTAKKRKKPTKARARKKRTDIDGFLTVLALDVGTLHIAHACIQLQTFADPTKDRKIVEILDWKVDCIFPEGEVAATKTAAGRSKAQLTTYMRKYLVDVFQYYKHAVDVLLIEMQDFANPKMTALSHVAQAVLGHLLQPVWEDVVPAMVKVHFVRARKPELVPPARYSTQGISKSKAYKWRKEGLRAYVEGNIQQIDGTIAKKDDLCDAMLIALSYTHYPYAVDAMNAQFKDEFGVALMLGHTTTLSP